MDNLRKHSYGSLKRWFIMKEKKGKKNISLNEVRKNLERYHNVALRILTSPEDIDRVTSTIMEFSLMIVEDDMNPGIRTMCISIAIMCWNLAMEKEETRYRRLEKQLSSLFPDNAIHRDYFREKCYDLIDLKEQKYGDRKWFILDYEFEGTETESVPVIVPAELVSDREEKKGSSGNTDASSPGDDSKGEAGDR